MPLPVVAHWAGISCLMWQATGMSVGDVAALLLLEGQTQEMCSPPWIGSPGLLQAGKRLGLNSCSRLSGPADGHKVVSCIGS